MSSPGLENNSPSADRHELLRRRLKGDRSTARAGIVPVPRAAGSSLALSFEQERLWLVAEAGGDRVGEYGVGFAVRLVGVVDVEVLARAVSVVVDRHEVLRSRFVVVDGAPVVVVAGSVVVEVPVVAMGGGSRGEVEEVVADAVAAAVGEPFDLRQGPLLRLWVYQVAVDECVLVVSMHHIVTDGWSEPVFVREVCAVYRALLGGGEPVLPVLPVQYGDYAVWQRQRAAGGGFARELAYWAEALAGLPVLDLPVDHPRPVVRSGRGAEWEFVVPESVVSGLRLVGREHDATLFMVVLAGFGVLLHRYSGQSDFGIGIALPGRNRPELEHLIGFFVNTLVVRPDFAGGPSFVEVLRGIRSRTLAAFEHGELPFQHLVRLGRVERDLGRPPLVQVMFQLAEDEEPAWELPGVQVRPYPVPNVTAKFDLTLSMTHRQGRLEARIGYSTDLFESSTIAALAGHLGNVLAAVATDPGQPVTHLELLTPDERDQLRHGFNPPRVADHRVELLHEVVAAQAGRSPDAVAVVCATEQLTYRQLDSRANRLARHLLARGAGPETLVAVCLPRGPDMVVALLAVLKAGAAYVPLDPEHPTERLGYLLADSDPRLLITYHDIAARLPVAAHTHTVTLDIQASEIAAHSDDDPAIAVTTGNLAYVIYTSGSTGHPKGIMAEHHGLANLISWYVRRHQLGPEDRTCQLMSLAFDGAVLDIWSSLASGASLHLVAPDLRLDPGELLTWLADNRITFAFLPTPLAEAVLRQPHPPHLTLRSMLTGGDRLTSRPPAGASYELVNNYGPTEITVMATAGTVPATGDGPPDIGTPIAGADIVVVNPAGRLVPVGVPGEILIGGAGVARGYLRRPALSAERFVPDVFSGPAGGRRYRTGDLARWRADGTLEFLGRTDRQIKIRGFRIEPAEIEAVLRDQPEIDDAVVTTYTTAQGDRRIAGYLTSADRQELTPAQLRSRLQPVLPSYMIPSTFQYLPAVPLNGSGKIDYRALPDPTAIAGDTHDPVPPVTPTEKALTAIWQTALDITRIGIHDNFFDIGGDSITAVKVVSLARAAGVEISMRDLIQRPTIHALGGDVDDLAGARPGPARPPAVETSRSRPTTLVRIKEGSLRPVFCVHPSGGSVRWYESLSRELPADWPLHAFQALGLTDGLAPDRSVEQAAQRYVAELRAVQPHGPYTLVSWSLGGVYAYEMAQILTRMGEPIDVLLLLEPSFPDSAARRRLAGPIDLYREGARITAALARPSLPERERAALTAELASVLANDEFSAGERSLGTDLPFETPGALLEAFCRYRIRPYPATLDLVVTDECRAASPAAPVQVAGDSFAGYLDLWRSVAARVTVHATTGRHLTMLDQHHAGSIALLLTKLRR